MTREEARYWLEHKEESNVKFWTAVGVAIKALEAEPCEDAVSRARVLRMIDYIEDHNAITPYKSISGVTEHLRRIARNMSSVTPKPKKGKWIRQEGWDGDETYICSNCNVEWTFPDGTPEENGANFCPECGSYNGGDDEE